MESFIKRSRTREEQLILRVKNLVINRRESLLDTIFDNFGDLSYIIVKYDINAEYEEMVDSFICIVPERGFIKDGIPVFFRINDSRITYPDKCTYRYPSKYKSIGCLRYTYKNGVCFSHFNYPRASICKHESDKCRGNTYPNHSGPYQSGHPICEYHYLQIKKLSLLVF